MLSQPQHSNMVRFQGMPVWQQVPNPRIPFAEDQRQREYLKQQQKLRLMASTSNKVNLLIFNYKLEISLVYKPIQSSQFHS